jgi:hypothetical protein
MQRKYAYFKTADVLLPVKPTCIFVSRLSPLSHPEKAGQKL